MENKYLQIHSTKLSAAINQGLLPMLRSTKRLLRKMKKRAVYIRKYRARGRRMEK